MLGRDRAQHGRAKQHREDGGAHLHHGTGQTVSSRSAGVCASFFFFECKLTNGADRGGRVRRDTFREASSTVTCVLDKSRNDLLRSLAFLSFRTFRSL